MKKKGSQSIYKKLRLVIGLFSLLLLAVFLMERQTERFAHYMPEYEKIDLAPILNKPSLAEGDYATLLRQTGLGKYAVDALRNQSGEVEAFLPYQEAFFAPAKFRCERLGPVTKQESLIDEDGEYVYGFPLAPMEDGFVLASKSTHTFGWRNGHVGLVVDAQNQLSLESITIGVNSNLVDANLWRSYPSFLMLRLKDADSSQLSRIAKTAAHYLVDLPYKLTPGVFSPKYADLKSITGTHCSHLVWEAFRYYGYDVDSNGGRIVTVKGIATSPLFEIVQIYGVNPDKPWE